MDLYYNRNVSTDNICSFFSDLFGIKFCKRTVVNREKELENKLMRYGQTSVSDVEFKNIVIQYRSILNDLYQEIKKDKAINPLYDEERKLQARWLQDEVQHLKFMTDFSLPYTNNRAETDIRGVKQRQKVGLFRNEEAAERYVTIKSCISTYKKNKINIFKALNSAFSNNTIII